MRRCNDSRHPRGVFVARGNLSHSSLSKGRYEHAAILPRVQVGLWCGLSFLIAICAFPSPSRGEPTSTPRFEATPCPADLDVDDTSVDCGVLVVRENRRQTDGRLLRLAITILRAQETPAKTDPVVYLSGGPGSAEATMASTWVDHPLRRHRDIILMGQRGTGRSEPVCPELFRQVMGILARDLDLATEREAHRQAGVCARQKRGASIWRSIGAPQPLRISRTFARPSATRR